MRGQDGSVGEILFWPASLGGIVHMVIGLMVFSSLLFVGALDAIPVLLRYAASAGVCQAILLVELADIRLDLAEPRSDEDERVERIVEVMK